MKLVRPLLALAVCTTVAHAQTAVLRFEGTVNAVTPGAFSVFPDAQIGDAMTLRMVIETEGLAPFSIQNYDVQSGNSTLQIGDTVHAFADTGMDAFTYSPCDHGFDWFISGNFNQDFLEIPEDAAWCRINYNGSGCNAIPAGLEDMIAASPITLPIGFPSSKFWVENAFGILGATFEVLAIGDEGLQLYCSPAEEHFGGDRVTLANSSFAPGSTMELHLEATGGPANQFGFFFMGPGYGPEFTVFNGTFCLSQPIARYNLQAATNQGLSELNSLGQFDGNGVMQNLAGTSSVGTGFDVPLALPYSPAGQMITSGDTWFFQFWYRDVDDQGQPSANYSDALSATFE